MNAIALQEPVSKLRGPVTDYTLPGHEWVLAPLEQELTTDPMADSYGLRRDRALVSAGGA